jgi:hypothetical protein
MEAHVGLLMIGTGLLKIFFLSRKILFASRVVPPNNVPIKTAQTCLHKLVASIFPAPAWERFVLPHFNKRFLALNKAVH